MDSVDLSPQGARRIYRILCNLADSDGTIAASERRVLSKIAQRLEIGPAEAKTLEAEAVQDKLLKIGKSEAEQEALVGYMIDVAVADGVLDQEERTRLIQVATAIGLSLKVLKARVKARLGQQSAKDAGALAGLSPASLKLAAYVGYAPAREKLGAEAPPRPASAVNFVSGLRAWGNGPVLQALVPYVAEAVPIYRKACPGDPRLDQVLAAAEYYVKSPGETFAQICAGVSLGAENAADDAEGAAGMAAQAVHKLALAVFVAESGDSDGLRELTEEAVALAATAIDLSSGVEARERLRTKIEARLQEWVLANGR